LLRAAELSGFPTDGEFPLCPKEARLPVTRNHYRDFFSELAMLSRRPRS
jgi:hypothetical protein